METKQILVEAKALIEKGWAQGAYCRDKRGEAILFMLRNSHKDVCYCTTGALMAVNSAGVNSAVEMLYKQVSKDEDFVLKTTYTHGKGVSKKSLLCSMLQSRS